MVLTSFSKVALSFFIVALGSPTLSPVLSAVAASLGYAIFWMAALELPQKKRFWLSLAWFAGVQAIQLSWMTSMVYFGPAILIIYFLLLVGLGLQFAFMTGCLSLPLKWNNISALAGFWVLMEWVRLFLLTGFTWNPVGLTLAANSLSIQFAALFGVYGLCFWVMWVNLFALKALLERGRKQWTVWLAFALLPYGYGAVQKAFLEPYLKEDRQIEVALIQTGMRPEQRDRLKERNDAHIHPLMQWRQVLSHLTRTNSTRFDLIVFPEGALPGGARSAGYTLASMQEVWCEVFGSGAEVDFPPMRMPFAKEVGEGTWRVTNSFWAQSLANHYGAEVIIGLDDGENGKHFNAAFHFKPRINEISRYEKQILIPGGEYIPLEGWKWLDELFAKEFGIESSFQAGQKAKVFSGAFPIGIFICLEETYSKLVREVRQGGAQIFVNIANDVWFPKTRLPWHHFDHGRIRAAENGMPLLRACNTGVTAAVDCFGSAIEIFPVSEEAAGALVVKVPLSSYSTLYTFIGDLPVVLASSIFFSFFAFGRWIKKKKLP